MTKDRGTHQRGYANGDQLLIQGLNYSGIGSGDLYCLLNHHRWYT
jgi:hypothetical protein